MIFLPWLFRAAALTHMAAIFYLSHQPTVPLPPLFPHQDKLFHFIAYFILGFCVRASFTLSREENQKKLFWIALGFASMYGMSDEFHQTFVPGRTATIDDWIADTLGAWAGVTVCVWLLGKLNRIPHLEKT